MFLCAEIKGTRYVGFKYTMYLLRINMSKTLRPVQMILAPENFGCAFPQISNFLASENVN